MNYKKKNIVELCVAKKAELTANIKPFIMQPKSLNFEKKVGNCTYEIVANFNANSRKTLVEQIQELIIAG